MAVTIRTQRFLDSQAAETVRLELIEMMEDPVFNTRVSYSAALNGDISFVDKHMNYLSSHLAVDPDQYMSNLKLITKYN
ncbi:hypothetical protein H7142_03985 [Candidatus Saccharibacteria bacterium]|nr:hypothetical protein [Candidatus Saccharibacteria bacterium]